MRKVMEDPTSDYSNTPLISESDEGEDLLTKTSLLTRITMAAMMNAKD